MKALRGPNQITTIKIATGSGFRGIRVSLKDVIAGVAAVKTATLPDNSLDVYSFSHTQLL